MEGEALAVGGRSGGRSCQGRLLRRGGVGAKGRSLPCPLLLLSHLMPMISKGIVAAAAAAIEVVIAHLMVEVILVVAVLLLLKIWKSI